jgi:hypothetical protein
MAKKATTKVAKVATTTGGTLKSNDVVFSKLDVSNVATTVTMDAKALNAAITAIHTAGNKLDKNVHTVAIQCILHAREHGDCRPLTRLFFAIPASGRAKTFRQWCLDFAPLVWSKEESKAGLLEHFKLKAEHPADLFKVTEAAATPFWVAYKEQEPMVFDLDKVIKQLSAIVRNVNKHINDAPENERGRMAELANRTLRMLPADVQAKLLADTVAAGNA